MRVPRPRLAGLLLVLYTACGAAPVAAQVSVDAKAGALPSDARGWLARIHAAANGRSYQGTMVFSTGGVVSSSRVAHYCVGDQVFERIEALDGKMRQVYRHNDVVHTIWPQSGTAVIERRLQQLHLPSAMQSVEPRALEQYELRAEGRDRVAGREAVVLLLQPRDDLRFAQRVWSDLETGLLLRSDVIGPARVVLESSAFSEVDIDVKPQPETVLQPIRRLDGMTVLRPPQVPTQLESTGWSLTRPVAGFRLASCVRRTADPRPSNGSDASASEVVQAVFSDGLTHVSIFIEPHDPTRHRKPIVAQFGATHSLAGRQGGHWITAMGDVPMATLRLFVDALSRRP